MPIPHPKSLSFRRLWQVASASVACLLTAVPAALHAGTFPALGVYVGNPNGNDANAEASFEAAYNRFVAYMGQTPATMDVFVDYTQSISTWVNNAGWAAWSMAKSAPVKSLIPVVSVGLVDQPTGDPGGNWNRTAALGMMNAVASGTYDSVYTGIVNAYKSNGFTNIYLRIGWEMDGGWEPWYSTGDSGMAAAFVSAFQRVATVARGVAGITVKTVWCPSVINWTAVDLTTTYPGDAYVDVVGPDLYSPCYPGELHDWSSGVNVSSATIWAASTINREHFWDYPGATEWVIQGGWGLTAAINFAKAHGKAFGLSETGAGNNGGSTGPTDEGDFPNFLAARLSAAVAQGVTIAFVNVWDINVSDGKWLFSDGSKPNEGAAWKQFVRTMSLAVAGNAAKKFEAESLTVANYVSQAGGTARVMTDTPLSNGSAVILDSNNVGDYFTLVVPNISAQKYDVRVGIKKSTSRGQFQLQIGRADNFNGTFSNVAGVQDEYAAASVYPEIDLGTWQPGTTSDKWFRFNVVGKNSASTGASYNDAIAVDYITLVPQ